MHSHRKLAAHLAKAARRRVVVLDYRLAPEQPVTTPLAVLLGQARTFRVADIGPDMTS